MRFSASPLRARLTRCAPITRRATTTANSLVKESQLPVGHSTTFTFGAGSKWNGQRGVVYRESATTFKVFDLICTHHGCTAVPTGAVAQCPCHFSTFSLKTGAPLSGPAQLPLTGSRVKIVKGVVRWVADA